MTSRARITTITGAQRARMLPFAHEWIEWALTTGPCTPADRARVEDGIRRCYELSGLRWHGRVVWCTSPIIAAFAAPIAAALTVHDTVGGTVGDTVAGTVRGTVGGTVADTVAGTVDGTVHDTVAGTVHDTVAGTVRGTVDGTVAGTVGGTVGGTVHDTVADTVVGTVGGTVHDTVAGTVGEWSLRPTDFALIAQHRDAVRKGWPRYLSSWWSWWQASNAFCIRELGACPDLRGNVDAWRDACAAGWWYPHADHVIVADRPVTIRLERVGPDGWGSHRMHCADGPAIRWADGYGIYCWHGVVVPAWVIETPTVERIAAERNAEVRRCAIESYGWDRYIDALGVTPIDECPDPGNGDRTIRLFRLPAEHQPYDRPVAIIVVHNGSVDRGGHRRTYALTVPADETDALTAVARTYGRTRDEYAAIARRT